MALSTTVIRIPRLRLVALVAALLMLACSDDFVLDLGERPEPLVPIESAAELEDYLKEALRDQLPSYIGGYPYWGGPMMYDTTMTPMAPVAGAPTEPFSTTNLQEAGVDEPDPVKFDGRHLYIAEDPIYVYGWEPMPMPMVMAPMVAGAPATVVVDVAVVDEALFAPVPWPPEPPDIEAQSEARVRVYEASSDPAAAEEIAEIPLPEKGMRIEGLLLLEEGAADEPPLLVALGGGSANPWMSFGWDAPWDWWNGRTSVTLFDVTDPTAAAELWRLSIEGTLVASRRIGDMLYLVTRQTPFLRRVHAWPDSEEELEENRRALETATLAELLPVAVENGGEEESLVSPRDCFLPESVVTDEAPYYAPTLVTVTAVNLRAPRERVSVCMAGQTNRIYSSRRALYLTAPSRRGGTLVHKFAYTDDGPRYRGAGAVRGHVSGSNPTFGLGEHEGVLGIVTTEWKTPTPDRPTDNLTHRLTLLRESEEKRALERAAVLPNRDEPKPIGKPGENVRGVRFLGDRVYVVTYRNIDPLYVIDVADPEHPFIAGDLEIPGFSDYLHPVGRDLLVGIGKDTLPGDRNDWFQGVKVELFDVSDPSALRSIESLSLGKRGSQSAALSDHHAVSYLNMGDGLHRLAVPVQVHDTLAGGESGSANQYYDWSYTGLHLFEIDEGAPGEDARIEDVGAVVSDHRDDPEGADYGYSQMSTWGDRSSIQGPAVHYVHESGQGKKVWSAPWDAPEDAVGPQ